MTQTTTYVTRIQLAVPTDILPEMQRLLTRQALFQLCKESLTDGRYLLESVDDVRPDVLILDMTLPELDQHQVLATLSNMRIRRYVLATAPHYDPHLLGLQEYRAVRGALPHVLALSPVLRHVLAGIAEGSEYFVVKPLDHHLSGLTRDEVILLALMAMGLETAELVRDLECTTHVVYNNQSRLRRKLGVPTNPKAILAAVRMGVVGVLAGRSDQAAA